MNLKEKIHIKRVLIINPRPFLDLKNASNLPYFFKGLLLSQALNRLVVLGCLGYPKNLEISQKRNDHF
jgi:hypothetical protein